MTETEITLFKELIRETVRSVLKEERLKTIEEVKKSTAKDLKEIKLLIAKQIKENRERSVSNVRMVEQRVEPGKAGQPLSVDRQKALKLALNSTARSMGMPSVMTEAPSPEQALRNIKESRLDSTTKSILMQTARDMTMEDKEALNEDYSEVLSESNQTQDDYSLPDDVEDEYVPKYARGLPQQPNL